MMPKQAMNFIVVAAIALTVGLVEVPAFAQDETVQSGGWRQGYGRGWRDGMQQRGGRYMQRFTIIDANDDGEISDDEAAAQREGVFFAMDSDDNGELTEEEYMAVRMGPGEGRNSARQAERQQAKRARFKPMDTDKSGTVSKAEWMAAGEARFAAADADGDGIVTPWEFRSQHRD